MGFGEDDQDRFRNATVGLLSAAHLSAIEDPDRYPIKISADQAVTIAKDLGAPRGAGLVAAARQVPGPDAPPGVAIHRNAGALDRDQRTRMT